MQIFTLHGADDDTSNSEYVYRFDQSDSSNNGHPLRFYLQADKTNAYTTGVTTNGKCSILMVIWVTMLLYHILRILNKIMVI